MLDVLNASRLDIWVSLVITVSVTSLFFISIEAPGQPAKESNEESKQS